MHASRRLRARTVLLIVAGVLLAGWLIPPFFHAGRYRKLLQSTLENRLGRRVEFGAVTLRLLPHPGFSIENVMVYENPGFGSEPFARVDQAECDLRWRSLWGSRLDCSRIVLRHPVLNAVRDSQGRWNMEEFFHRGRAEVRAAARSAIRPASEPFSLEVDGARINFTIDGVKKPFALDKVDAQFQFNPARRAVGFRIQGTPLRTDLALQPPGPFLLSGEWKPAAGFNGPFHLRFQTHGSLLSGWLPLILHRDPGVYGLVDADLQFEGSAQNVKAAGRMQISQLHLRDSLPPSTDTPVSLSFSADLNRDQGRLEIQKADAVFARSRLHLTGEVQQIFQSRQVDLALTLTQCRLQDLVALANRLARRPTSIGAAGRVDGVLKLQGPWGERHYGGSLQLSSVTLRSHGAEFFSRQAAVRVEGQRVQLLPTHFHFGSGIRGVARGNLFLPESAPRRLSGDPTGGRVSPRYELDFAVKKAPLRSCLGVARSMGVRHLRDLDATGWLDGSVRLQGGAWPFSRPQVVAQGDLDSARLLVAGLTEPIRFSRFHFELARGTFTASPVTAGIGDATFSGWLKRSPAAGAAWQFEARTPHLGLEQASLWFAVLGYRRPMPILDLIPGLRSFAERATASRNVFAALNARGGFECPDVTFHALTLKDFHARLALAGRVANMSRVNFRIAGGKGDGSAEIDFKQAPARIVAHFGLSDLRMQRFAAKLPAALGGMMGALSAEGTLATRGLTRPEMASHLTGTVAVHLKNVTLGRFDPLEAAARAASIGILSRRRREPSIPALDANLSIRRRTISLSPAKMLISGAALSLAGSYTFNGIADLTLHADLSHVHRQWLNGGDAARPRRTASLRLAGRLNHLNVTPVLETAQTHQ